MIQSFNPPVRTLMGPGPSDIAPRVLAAMSRPTIGHLDPAFIQMMDEIKQMLQYAFQTKNELTMPVSAPGSAGMETCFVNLVEPGDKVIVCQNGVFGGRMKENVERCGGVAVMVEDDWGTAVSVDKVQAALEQNPDAKVLAFVHAETSTGAISDAKALCALAREHDCLTIVDAVTSLGGSELRVDEWGIDAIYSGTQKCLSCPPGISPVSFSERAVEAVKARKTSVPSWFLDTNLVMGYWGAGAKRAYHHTAPVNALYALHEGLVMLQDEGLENAWARHDKHHQALRAGLEAMGLKFLVAEGERLPQLNSVFIPEGVDDAALRTTLLNDYSLEIGAGLGAFAGKVWRIGLMGAACTQRNVMFCLMALENTLLAQGISLEAGKAGQAALAVYQ
ncbi:pyridoxal-phosphate-dependent aminotransferase family protein [Oceanospirillum linum]|uniref:Alanine--glyoxylate aminotransferase n=1 Tax=Oceanospirillum linum TaxID=966 RepID=A0A1T1H8E7_OCELI|nr:alanine--glyoxylate aminotransferase family protein [Oceanospirillum linum]OOV85987.1 alanine--glyoxylate aminotransferase [Oceanospirillum linum]SEG44392.1 alanine-glyoxylate transaminase / serine-glyoxylate transaminase / serine-pyruvate transaminase [Oleiphilus messinensis]SMP34337.1 alanine-glyoxylate transaminase / serine-glyoxylate transaminase / serine-pyruvate transaminase [Oceanospirillum linum]